MRRGMKALGALVLAGALVGSGQAAKAADPVAGAGSSFAGKIIAQWITDTGRPVSYEATGSGDGRSKLAAGAVDFAASDSPAPQAQADELRAKYGDFVYVPVTAGGVAVMYNLPELPDLKLSGATLAKVFSGTITNWSDPAIALDNGAPGPDAPITVVFRSDKSGTSAVMTGYLDAAGEGNWPGGVTEQFPGPANGKGAEGSSGVAGAVEATAGSIGYADHAVAMSKSLAEVMVENAAGAANRPEPGAVSAALAEAQTHDDGTITVNFQPADAAAYPIVAVTFVLAPTKIDGGKAETLKGFLDYGLGAGQDKAPEVGYAPFPNNLREFAKGQAAKITAG